MKRGITCGVFDLFHAGHVLMLAECKMNCNFLTVAINSCLNIDYTINPGKKPPIFNLEDRVLIMKACRFVDEVIVYNDETELAYILNSGNYNIRFLGEDYRNKPITAPTAPLEVYYTDRSHGKSTSGFRLELERGM